MKFIYYNDALRFYTYYLRKMSFVTIGVVQEGTWPANHQEKHHVHENIVCFCSERIYVIGNKINTKEEWSYSQLQLFKK